MTTDRVRSRLRPLIATALSTVLIALTMSGAFAATIATDLWVYQDGDTVTVTGVEFGPAELVDLVTTDPLGTVVDTGTATTDEAGSLVYAFILRATVGGIYDIVATGRASGLVATTQFDPPAIAITFPASGASVTSGDWASGCAAAAIVGICGTATDPLGISAVAVGVQGSNGLWWDGSAFALADQTLRPATGTTSWKLALPAAALANVGIHAVVVRATDANNAANKRKDATVGTTFTVVTDVRAAIAAADKVYDGSTEARITSCAVVDAPAADVTCSATGGSFDAPGAGLRSVTATAALAGPAAAFYRLAGVDPTTATISPRPVTPTIAASDRTYDGTTVAAATCSLEGTLPGDDVTCTGSASFDAADAGARTVTMSGIGLAGGSSSNHALTTTSAQAAATIERAPLGASVVVQGKLWDGTADATLAGCSITGAVAGESLDCLTAGSTASFAASAPGTHTVTVTGLTVEGVTVANYDFDGTASGSGEIQARGLIARISAVARAYDGTRSATIADCTLEGAILVPGSVACDTSRAAATFAAATAGIHPLDVTGVALGGAAAGGYALTVEGAGTIEPRQVTAGVGLSDRAYDGTRVVGIAGCTLVGAVVGDDVTCVSTGATATSAAAGVGPQDVDVSGLTLGGEQAANYAFDGSATGSMTISPAPLAATVTVAARIWDGTDEATITGCTLSGVVAGESLDCVTTGATASFASSDPGSHAVAAGGLSIAGATAAAYVFDGTATGTGEIEAKQLTAVVTVAPKTYDGTTAATVTGCSLTVEIPDVACSAIFAHAAFGSANAGMQTVLVTALRLMGAAAGAYELDGFAATSALISPAPIGVRGVSVTDKPYDGTTAAAVAGCELETPIGDDLVTCDASGAAGAFAAAGVGSHAVDIDGLALTGADGHNYRLGSTRAGGTATIHPKRLAATVTLVQKTYDGTTSATIAGCSLAGVAGAEDVTCDATGASATFADANAGLRSFTATGLALAGAGRGNYELLATVTDTARIAGIPVIVEVSGGASAVSGTATMTADLVTFSARMTARTGDLGSATTKVSLVPVGAGGSIDSTCAKSIGAGEVVFACSARNVPVGAYEIVAQATGNYEGTGYDAYTVFESASGYASGGGHFYIGADKVNFGFTMKYNRSGSQVQGNLILVRHFPDGTVARLKSNSIGTLGTTATATKGSASFNGKSVYSSMAGGEWVSSGNNLFTVYVEDLNQPGTGIDRIWVSAPGWFKLPGSATVELAGGNIVVPHGKR